MDLKQWYSSLNKTEKGKAKTALSQVIEGSVHTARSYLVGARPIPFKHAIDICRMTDGKVTLAELAQSEKERV